MTAPLLLLTPSWSMGALVGFVLAVLMGSCVRTARHPWAAALLAFLLPLAALCAQPVFETTSWGRGASPALLLQAVSPDLGIADRGLPFTEAWLGPQQDGAWSSGHLLSIGLTGLALALFGAFGVGGRIAWAGRLVLAVGLSLFFLGTGKVANASLPTLTMGLTLLSAAGLAALLERRAEDAAMGLSWGVVALAAATALAALHAGSSTDAEALRPWLGEATPGLPFLASGLAEALRSTLDRAALSAFAAMTALLVFLRYRGGFGASLLILVAVVDAWRPWLEGR
jgi:hypothetical protein